MKRDMQLIRAILLDVERKADGRTFVEVHYPEVAPDVVHYHIRLLQEAGLVEAVLTRQMAQVGRLTWEGHEFLDNIRNDAVWRATLKRVAERGGSAAFSIVVRVAEKLAMDHFGLGSP